MTLNLGTTLGTYEILDLVGKGGMGEVYRARDTKLKREVAIKILPEEFSRDTDRVARFQREAEVLASLNHPNIAGIHDLQEANGYRFLVMELVEGETLADRIARGAVPLDEALTIANQMCEGLEAAHGKGIIHRDLKPANIKLLPDGKVKLLDFGLAKAFEADTSKTNQSQSPTLSMQATNAGLIMGTAAYMSPEQARGRPVDQRTDVWAFGVVIYELLTGKPLFQGDDVTETLASVVKDQPDLAAVPARMRRLLEACLQKDPRKRLQAIGDARLLMESVPSSDSRQAPRNALRWLWPAAALIFAIVVLSLWTPWRVAEVADKQLLRLEVDLGADVSLDTRPGNFILSPDGNRIAFISRGRLFTRRLDQDKAVDLSGMDSPYSPFFSPDGKWIAFFTTQTALKKVSVEGGSAIKVCDCTGGGGSWGEDGTMVLGSGGMTTSSGSLNRVSADGSKPAELIPLDRDRKEVAQRWPQFLPGGKAVLFTSNGAVNGFDNANIDVVSLGDHRRKTLVQGGTFGRYLSGPDGSGYLTYVTRGTLFALPFDVTRLEVRGSPSPVLNEVSYSTNYGYAEMDVSKGNIFVYRSGGIGLLGSDRTVALMDNSGKSETLVGKPAAYQRPRWSPDGKRLAIEFSGDVFVYEPARDILTRLTFDGGSAAPIWAPDGRYIVFMVNTGLSWVRSDGASGAHTLTEKRPGSIQYANSFTPNQDRLAFMETTGPTTASYDLWTVPVKIENGGVSAGKPEPFLKTAFDERHPAFSPDGRWIAYASNESGTFQIYVRSFPDKGSRWQVSSDGGMYPMWSHTAPELFFRTEENLIMNARYAVNGDSFMAEKPRVWSEKRLANLGMVSSFDLAPDGKRVAAIMSLERSPETKPEHNVTFLLNFVDEIRRRAN